MLDMRRLRVLHAVSAHGSVTAAAAALGYSAPAVSQQLAALEREVGMQLTERAGRGIGLTTAADLLVAHTDALLAQLDAAEADLAALRDQVAGRVTLAAFPSAAAAIVPAAWATLAGSAPHVQLDLVEMEPEEALPAAARGEIDVATSPQMRHVLEELLQPRPGLVIVDLSDVSFIDSTGLGVIVTAMTTARNRGGSFALFALPAKVRTLVELTRLHLVFDIYADEVAALAAPSP